MRTQRQKYAMVCGAAMTLCAAPVGLRAQSMERPIKPGLWETQSSMKNSITLPPEVEARIAAMPEAQQAQMRSMMGGAGAGGAPIIATHRSCIAQQTSLDKLLNEEQGKQMQCSFTSRAQTADGVSFDTSCTMPQGTATGHSVFHLVDDEHATGTMHMVIDSNSHGQTMHMVIEGTFSTKYLGADCGDVKPYAPPAK